MRLHWVLNMFKWRNPVHGLKIEAVQCGGEAQRQNGYVAHGAALGAKHVQMVISVCSERSNVVENRLNMYVELHPPSSSQAHEAALGGEHVQVEKSVCSERSNVVENHPNMYVKLHPPSSSRAHGAALGGEHVQMEKSLCSERSNVVENHPNIYVELVLSGLM